MEELVEGYIVNQNGANIKEYEFGYGTGGGNICGPIALFNVLHHLGEDVLFSKVIDDLEKGNGMFLDGILGSQPYELQQNLIDTGYTTEAEHLYFQTEVKLDEHLKEHDAAIIMYLYFTPNIGGHYITVFYDEDRKEYSIYGESSTVDVTKSYDEFMKDEATSPNYYFIVIYVDK